MADNYKNFSNEYIDEIQGDPSNNYFTPVLEKAYNITKAKNVLDVGCGNGIFSINLKNKFGCKLSGVDGNAYAIEKANQIGFDEVKQVRDFCSDEIPYKDYSFDLIICKDVLEHLVDPEFLLLGMKKKLKQEGFVLVHVPNHFTLWGRLKFLFNNNIDCFNYFPGAERWAFPHIRFFTFESLVKIFEKNDFALKTNLSDFFPSIPGGRFLPFHKKISKLLANKYPDNFSEGLTLIFQKRR